MTRATYLSSLPPKFPVWMPFSFATQGTLTHPSSPRSNAASSVKPSLIHPLESGVSLCLSQCSDHTVIAIFFSRACLWSFDQLVSFTSLLEHRAGQLFSLLPRPDSGSDTLSKCWMNGWIEFSTKGKCLYSPLPLPNKHFLSTYYVSSIPRIV